MAFIDYYKVLGLSKTATADDIRKEYRKLARKHHPDLNPNDKGANLKFQQLNEAYATLSNPDRKTAYDLTIGYSRVAVVQPLPSLNRPQPKPSNSSAYIDATDRPLSPGEMFALFILGLTFLGCLLLAITIGFARGETAFQPITADAPISPAIVSDLKFSSVRSVTVAPAIPAPSKTNSSTLPKD